MAPSALVQSPALDKAELPKKQAITSTSTSTTIVPFSLVAKASFITAEFHDLIYSAAASLQLMPILNPHWAAWQNTLEADSGSKSSTADSKIIASPYNDAKHLLDLNSVSVEDRIFALALTTIRPVRPDYATEDLRVGLNVGDVNDMVRRLSSSLGLAWTARSYYLVIFRSKMLDSYDNARLFDLDKHSHREAMESGGLLKYWFGTVNENRRNLAFCIWRNRQDARDGGRGPWHALARREARHFYEFIDFSTYKLTIEDAAAAWTLEPWSD